MPAANRPAEDVTSHNSIAPGSGSVHSHVDDKHERGRFLLDYIRQHWAGSQPLAWSFWINFALLCAIINMIEPYVRPGDLEASRDHAWFSILPAMAYLIVGHLVVYPWQVIGLLRACRRYLERSSDSVIVTGAQLAVVASLIAGLVTMSTTLQSMLKATSETHADAAEDDVVRAYAIELIAERSVIRIDGEFANGLTRDLRQALDRSPDVRGIVLDSDGGRIFEARGVANLIGERRLTTYVYGVCQSACTTAFIAGSPRYLGEQGRLGFHQYRLNAVHPFIDIAEEQEKDRAFYRSRGIAPDLLARIFGTPHDTMWYPTRDELMNAHVVDAIIPHDGM